MLEQTPDGGQTKLCRSAIGIFRSLRSVHQYIDLDYDGNVRKCLLDKDGKRLLDSNGSPKTLRHKFAVYCDDIAAGANTLEECCTIYMKIFYAAVPKPAFKSRLPKSSLV